MGIKNSEKDGMEWLKKQKERNKMLELKNVTFEVSDEKAQKEIIRGINLKIDDNKFVVITGPNGGGKSTLAKLIVGIEKPPSGQI